MTENTGKFDLFAEKGQLLEQAVAVARHEGAPGISREEPQPNSLADTTEEDSKHLEPNRGLSPFFGFPERASKAQRNNYGFYCPSHRELVDYPYSRCECEYLVGIFGGSVAAGFCRDTASWLENELSQRLFENKRDVRILNFSMGALKQPGQLFYLNYFLSLGQEFDIIVNLDGYNDTVGAIFNLTGGIHPAMPLGELINSFHSLVSIPQLDAVQLSYFLKIVKLQEWLKCVEKWPLNGIGLKSILSSKLNRERRNPPESSNREYLMELPRVDPIHYGHSDEIQRALLRREISDIWFRASYSMQALAEAHKAHYMHILQPNHQFLNKALTREERRLLEEDGNPHAQIIIQEIYPELLEIGKRLPEKVFCPMTDVFDSVESTILADGRCHFNKTGHGLIAERLCGYIENLV